MMNDDSTDVHLMTKNKNTRKVKYIKHFKY